jgi:release factor glutamine methyltransferase
MVERRLKGEPPAYIVGSWEFYSLPLCITRDVLIPRVDTEILAKAAIERLNNDDSPRILDLCTGSGCVGLAIASNVPNSKVTLLDNSENAVKIAKLNARILGHTVTCVTADVLQPPAPQLGSFDMIVCNPPYIQSSDIDKLDESVKNFEPLSALDGGEDGLTFYRAVVKSWSKLIKDDGYLLFEVGEGQLDAVRNICLEADFAVEEVIRDTGGIDRVIVAEKVIS